MTPTHTTSASVVRTKPFVKPAEQSPSQDTDRPTSSDLPGTEVLLQGTSIPANLTLTDFRPDRPRTAEITGNDPAALERQSTSKSAFEPTRRDSFSSESDSDSVLSDWPPVDIYVEEGQDVTITHPDQCLSEEQTYKETMRGIWLYIGWTHIPDIDSSAATFCRP